MFTAETKRGTTDSTFSLWFGQRCYWPAPPPVLPLPLDVVAASQVAQQPSPGMLFGCRGENEEGALTGQTRLRSRGTGRRNFPRGRLRRRRSFLHRNSHGGLLNPRRKTAFPSETEREWGRKGEERGQVEENMDRWSRNQMPGDGTWWSRRRVPEINKEGQRKWSEREWFGEV